MNKKEHTNEERILNNLRIIRGSLATIKGYLMYFVILSIILLIVGLFGMLTSCNTESQPLPVDQNIQTIRDGYYKQINQSDLMIASFKVQNNFDCTFKPDTICGKNLYGFYLVADLDLHKYGCNAIGDISTAKALEGGIILPPPSDPLQSGYNGYYTGTYKETSLNLTYHWKGCGGSDQITTQFNIALEWDKPLNN